MTPELIQYVLHSTWLKLSKLNRLTPGTFNLKIAIKTFDLQYYYALKWSTKRCKI
jgi:hypothetical protein